MRGNSQGRSLLSIMLGLQSHVIVTLGLNVSDFAITQLSHADEENYTSTVNYPSAATCPVKSQTFDRQYQ